MAGTYNLRSDSKGGAPSSEVKPAGQLVKSREKTSLGQPSSEERRQTAERAAPSDPGRLASLDAYRGFIMIVLAASGFGIATFAEIDSASPVWKTADYETWQKIGFHFRHPAWRSNFRPEFLSHVEASTEFLNVGVSFWDLIQPAFMFMVGVAMPFSYRKRSASGQSAVGRLAHAVWRGLVLVLMGAFLYSMREDRTHWIFTNVLAQIGLGYVFVYLLLGRKLWFQLLALAGVLVGSWLFMESYKPLGDYDYAAVNASADKGEVYSERFASWSKNANAAHEFDVRFLNLLRTLPEEAKSAHGVEQDATDWAREPARSWFFAGSEPFLMNEGGYQTLNFVPSIATMLLGVVCGALMLSSMASWKKLGVLLVGGLICMALGLLAAETVCPIVKRIWTPSWALFSGAYVMWMLAGFYFLFDVLPLKWLAFPLTVVGMNSIAVYMMGQLTRGWTQRHVVQTHLDGVLTSAFGTEALGAEMYGPIIYTSAAAAVFWLVTFWMYRRKIFVRV